AQRDWNDTTRSIISTLLRGAHSGPPSLTHHSRKILGVGSFKPGCYSSLGMGKQAKGPKNQGGANCCSPKSPGLASPFFLFARNFLRHPNMVGWMLPSSPFVVDEVLKQIDWANAKVIVEYGPGVGTFTGEVLRR